MLCHLLGQVLCLHASQEFLGSETGKGGEEGSYYARFIPIQAIPLDTKKPFDLKFAVQVCVTEANRIATPTQTRRCST